MAENQTGELTVSDLYSEAIMELAARIDHTKRLDAPQSSAVRNSPLCGSRVTIDLAIRDGVVGDYGQEVRACLLGQASASIMGHNIVGSSPQELRSVRDQVEAMLKRGGKPPTGKWSDIAALEPVRDVRARHASTLLVFDAVCDALDKIESVQNLEDDFGETS